MKWLPIETAPKGRAVLVGGGRFVTMAIYEEYHPNAKGKAVWRALMSGYKLYPTHWLKLPRVPKS